MKKSLLLLITLLAALNAPAQNCEYYKDLMQRADKLWKQGKFEQALNQLTAAREHCPDSAAVVDARLVFFTNQIAKKYTEAKEQKIKADKATAKARQQARTAYANDLASKSKIALLEGDRNTAFRLAEFALRYVDATGNPQVIHALIDALYYNDNLSHLPLPRVANLEGHLSVVYCVAFSPDGKRLATGSRDSTAKIWDLESGKAIRTLKGHTSFVMSVAFSPDGKWLATASWDNTAKIWDLESGEAVLSLEEFNYVTSVAFSPDGKKLATASFDEAAKIWDLESGEIVHTFEDHTAPVWSVAFSPDGKKIATASWDETAKIWDVESGEVVHTFEGHKSLVYSVAFSPDGKKIATASWDETAKIWDVDSGEAIRTLEGHNSAVWNVAFSPSGEMLATGSLDNTAKIWDVESGKATHTLVSHTSSILSVAFSPDGNKLATGAIDKTAKIWDLDGGKSALAFEGHTRLVYTVAFSRDGKKLATGSFDNTAKIWDVENRKAVITLEGHSAAVSSVAFSPDGKRLATGSEDGTAKIWDVDSGEETHTLEGHNCSVFSVAFSPDGKRLATGSDDQTVKIWDVNGGKAVATLEGQTSTFTSVAFSPDGKKLATGSGNIVDGSNSIAIIWDLDSGKPEYTLRGHFSTIWSVAFSPNGRMLATGSGDKTVIIWDVNNGKPVISLEGHANSVRSVVFSPDSKRLATGAQDKTAKIWDLDNGKPIISLEGHASMVYSVAFSPDGRRIATGGGYLSGGKNLVKIWDLGADTLLQRWKEGGEQAGLTLPQLQQYNLEALLDQLPGNEARLIATRNVWQIKAFADLDAAQTLGSNDLSKVEPHYARAKRLYTAALALQDEQFIRQNYTAMLCRWAEVNTKLLLEKCSASELCDIGDYFFQKEDWPNARLFYAKSEQRQNSPKALIGLSKVSIKTGHKFEVLRFLQSKNTYDLKEYGDYLFSIAKKRPIIYSPPTPIAYSPLTPITYSYSPETPITYDTTILQIAYQLYEKAERLKHSPEAIIQMHRIARITGQPFDVQRFLEAKDVDEMQQYGDYLSSIAGPSYTRRRYDSRDAWSHDIVFSVVGIYGVTYDTTFLPIAAQLYEKAERLEHRPGTLIQLHKIAEYRGQNFDFERFLASEDEDDLRQYANYFNTIAYTPYKKTIPYAQKAVLLGEKVLVYDTTAETQRAVATYYNRLGYCQLFLPDGAAAEAALRRGLALDPDMPNLHKNLAHALLLQGRYTEAEKMYLDLKDKPFYDSDYQTAFFRDFRDLEKQGVRHPDIARLREMLEGGGQ